MPALDRSTILASSDLGLELVEVPEWGGHVHIRPMTGGERDAFEFDVTSRKNKNYRGVRARLIAMVVCDADGARMFSDEDVEELQAKNASALDRLFSAAQRISGLTDEDVEELEGN
jgi:hypothetical protein